MEKSKFSSSSDLLKRFDFANRLAKQSEHISQEYQDYGIRLAYKLNDPVHKALYIKLAKEIPRNIIESVAQFSLDYPEKKNSGNRGKIFMWKLKLICEEKKIVITGVKRKVNQKKLAQKKQIKLI